jgi:hypothetical protein
MGYSPGRVYRVADGSEWRQEDGRIEGGVYREDPGVRLLSTVWVVPGGKRWAGPGAF